MIVREVADIATEASEALADRFGEYLPDEVIQIIQKESHAPHDFHLAEITQVAGVVIAAANLAWSIISKGKSTPSQSPSTQPARISASAAADMKVRIAAELEVSLSKSVGASANVEELRSIANAVSTAVVDKLSAD